MTQSKAQYSIFVVLSTIYLIVIYRFQTTPKYILISTVVFALCYIGWGIAHHLLTKNFHTRIVLEYLLVAILGVAIVSTLLL